MDENWVKILAELELIEKKLDELEEKAQ